MKIVVIGDIHGRTFWKDVVNDERYKDLPVVFTGDYFDGYPDEWVDEPSMYFDDYEVITDVGAHHEVENFLDILVYKKTHPERDVTLLIGNHDLTYFYKKQHGSRYSNRTQMLLNNDLLQYRDYFTMCKEIDNVLFSHAGVTDSWLKRHRLSKENLEDTLNRMFDERSNAFFDVGYTRWGDSPTGSITWSDLVESKSKLWDFQVFGHTFRYATPYFTDNIACVDVMRGFIFDTETYQLFELDGTEIMPELKIFVSCPYTGYENVAKERCTKAVKVLSEKYPNSKIFTMYDVVEDVDAKAGTCMGQCVEFIIEEADMVVSLNGWEKSKGCSVERMVALTYGKKVSILTI